jgi:glutathione S-transferase
MTHTSGEQEPPGGVLRMYHIPGCPFPKGWKFCCR